MDESSLVASCSTPAAATPASRSAGRASCAGRVFKSTYTFKNRKTKMNFLLSTIFAVIAFFAGLSPLFLVSRSPTPFDPAVIESQVKTAVLSCKPGVKTMPPKDWFRYYNCPAGSHEEHNIKTIPTRHWCECDDGELARKKLISKALNAESQRVSDLQNLILYFAIFLGFVVWVSSFVYLKQKTAKSTLVLNRV